MKNTLYYGDNLDVLRDFPAEFVDLVYLDPPFNSGRGYNVLFKDESGHEADAQITAFEDTWHWNHHTEYLYNQLVTQADEPVSRIIEAMRQFIGPNQMMAYLVMMAARLVELHRVLKPTGSLYLHCDPTASHYLKVILIPCLGRRTTATRLFGKRTSVHNDGRQVRIMLPTPSISTKGQTIHLEPHHSLHSDEYVDKLLSIRGTETGRPYTLDNLTQS